MPGARHLFVTSILGRLPEGMESLALLLLFQHTYDSYALAGTFVALFALSGAGLNLVLGRWVARWGPVRVVLCCAAAQSLALLAVVISVGRQPPVAVVATLVVVGGLCGPPVSACARAAWQVAAPTSSVREAGYTLDAVLQELVWMAGPAIVTVCLILGGTRAPVVAIAVLVVAGCAVFGTTPLLRHLRPTTDASAGQDTPASGAPDGLACGVPARVKVLLVACAASGIGFGATEVGVPALADALDAPGAAGILLVAMSCGSVATGLGYGSRTWHSSVTARQTAAAAALGLLTCALVGASSLQLAIVLAFLAGAPWSLLLASQYAAFAAATPERLMVSVFTWSYTAAVIGIAAGAAAAGWLVERRGTDEVFLLAGAAFVVVAVLVASQVRPRPDRRRPG